MVIDVAKLVQKNGFTDMMKNDRQRLIPALFEMTERPRVYEERGVHLH